jgi:hypothetical protein
MYSELLQNSEEKVLLIAIDQRFINNDKTNEEEDNISNELIKELNYENEINSLEKLNVKFCESLDFSDDEKELSTEIDSDNLSINENQNKKFIFVNDFLNINNDVIKEIQNKIINDYKNHINLIDKIKAIFKNDKKQDNKNKKNNLK